MTTTESSVYNCTMINHKDKRLINKCAQLLMYNLGSLEEVSKCRGVLGNIDWYGAVTTEQRYFLTEWYERNQDRLDWLRF